MYSFSDALAAAEPRAILTMAAIAAHVWTGTMASVVAQSAYRLGMGLVFGLALTRAVAGGSPLYEITAILQGPPCPPFGDPSPLHISDINEEGIACGWYDQCSVPSSKEGFIWSAAQGMSLIPRPAGVYSLTTGALNDSDTVVGVMEFTDSKVGWMSFIYQPGGQATLLPYLPRGTLYGTFWRAGSINNRNEIAGDWGNGVTGNPALHAALWRDGVPIDLGAVLDGPFSQARDINERSQIVGWMGNGPAISEHGFIWHDGQKIDLGPIPGGITSSAAAINNVGDVVGSGRVPVPTPSGFAGHPFLWSKGRMIDLGVLQGFNFGGASDINDNGLIVGGFGNTMIASVVTAFLWEAGTMFDLNDQIPTNSGINLIGARAINNAGQIAASGRDSEGHIVGVVLTQIPFPTGDLDGDYVVNTLDLGILLSSWSIPATAPACAGAEYCPADINGDGFVNTLDLGMLLSSWTL